MGTPHTEAMDIVLKLDSVFKKQRHHFVNKGPYSQSYHFSSSHVRMWELNQEEGWALQSSCFGTVVLEKTLESLLDSKEMKPANPYQMIWYSHLLKNIPQFVVSHTVDREKENFTHLNKSSKE